MDSAVKSISAAGAGVESTLTAALSKSKEPPEPDLVISSSTELHGPRPPGMVISHCGMLPLREPVKIGAKAEEEEEMMKASEEEEEDTAEPEDQVEAVELEY